MCDPSRGGNPRNHMARNSYSYDRPNVQKETLQNTAAYPTVCFRFRSVLSQLFANPAPVQPIDPSLSLSGMDDVSEESDIWPCIAPSGITREAVDEAVRGVMPGHVFGWEPDDASAHGPGQNPVSDCSDPVLVIGVLARVNGSFYQADRSPDYTIGHLLKTVFACSEPRILANALRAEPAKQRNRTSKPLKRSK